jgi:hypothetical protein
VVDFKLVNTLVIANNFKLNQDYLQNFSNLKQVVVDGSNSNYVVNQVEKLCSKFGYAFYNTKKNGSYIVEL